MMKAVILMPLNGYESLCEKQAKMIVSRDSGTSREHRAENADRSWVTHYHIDGNVITAGNKCDYLLINEDKRVAYLIELKGADLVVAARQLAATIDRLSTRLSSYSLQYRIVASKCKTQEIESSEFKRYRMKWKRSLQYKTNILEEKI